MRIKKISPTTPANGNIENQYGTSQTNAYSEEYSNNTFASKNIENYSTTEQRIGTWINGKPLYRKVIDYYPTSLIGEMNTTTNVSIAHNITNFGNIIKVDMVDETGYIFPVFSSASGTYITVECGITRVDNTNINFRIINDNWSSRHFYITLEYTKTTD